MVILSQFVKERKQWSAQNGSESFQVWSGYFSKLMSATQVNQLLGQSDA